MPNISQTCSVFSELNKKHDTAKVVLWYESHSVRKKKSLLQTISFTEVANLLKSSRFWAPHLHARILHSQTQGKWWTPVEFWPCTHDLYSVPNVQDSVSSRLSAGKVSSWFLCCYCSQNTSLKSFKKPTKSIFPGVSSRGPQAFFTRCLGICSKNKIMLRFCFQLAGQKFSGLLPKSDLVLCVLRGWIQPLTVGTGNWTAPGMGMTPNFTVHSLSRPIFAGANKSFSKRCWVLIQESYTFSKRLYLLDGIKGRCQENFNQMSSLRRGSKKKSTACPIPFQVSRLFWRLQHLSSYVYMHKMFLSFQQRMRWRRTSV